MKKHNYQKKTVRKVAIKYDYDKAKEIIQIVESMISANKYIDVVDSTLFEDFIEPIQYERFRQEWIFIDKKAEDYLNELLNIYHKYSEHGNDYSSKSPRRSRSIKLNVLGVVQVSECSVSQFPKLTRDQYYKIYNEFLDKYAEFKQYIAEMKLFADTI